MALFWEVQKRQSAHFTCEGCRKSPSRESSPRHPKSLPFRPLLGCQSGPLGGQKGPPKVARDWGEVRQNVVPHRSPEGAPGPLPGPGRPGPARPAGPRQGLPRAPGRATSQSPGPWECPRAPGRRLPEPLGGSPTRAQGSWEWGLEWGFEYVKHHMIEFSQLLAFELQLFKTCAPSFSDLSPGREDSGAMHEMSTIASGCLPCVLSNPWQARLD